MRTLSHFTVHAVATVVLVGQTAAFGPGQVNPVNFSMTCGDWMVLQQAPARSAPNGFLFKMVPKIAI